LAKVEADITVQINELQKLHFYAVSPPTVLPNNVLSYNEKPNKDVDVYQTQSNNVTKNNIKQYILGQNPPQPQPQPELIIKSPPPYMQLHYIHDHLFTTDKDTSLLIKFLQKNVLKKISTEFQTYPNIEFTPINNSFYSNEPKKIIMLYNPTFKINNCIFKESNKSDESQKLKQDPFDFLRFHNGKTGLYYHAAEILLYIFFNYGDLFNFIRIVLGLYNPHPTVLKRILTNFENLKIMAGEKANCILKKFTLRSSKVTPQPTSGGNPKDKIHLLGKSRKIITKGRWQYVRYKNELITINQAKRLDQGREQRLDQRREQRLKNKSTNK
jgi:hypothetical protein